MANSRIIFERSQQLFSSPEFQTLAKDGANIQRVLWGSTSTKNPAYSDVKYVEELITKPTVNTVPEAALNAFLDHGKVENTFDARLEESKQVLHALAKFDIHMNEVCAELLNQGCVAFDKAFEELLESLERKAEELAAL